MTAWEADDVCGMPELTKVEACKVVDLPGRKVDPGKVLTAFACAAGPHWHLTLLPKER